MFKNLIAVLALICLFIAPISANSQPSHYQVSIVSSPKVSVVNQDYFESNGYGGYFYNYWDRIFFTSRFENAFATHDYAERWNMVFGSGLNINYVLAGVETSTNGGLTWTSDDEALEFVTECCHHETVSKQACSYYFGYEFDTIEIDTYQDVADPIETWMNDLGVYHQTTATYRFKYHVCVSIMDYIGSYTNFTNGWKWDIYRTNAFVQ